VKRWSQASLLSPRGSARGSFLGINTPRGSMKLSDQLAASGSQSRRSMPSPRPSMRGRSGSTIEIVLGAGGLDNLPRTPKRKSRASTMNLEDVLGIEHRGDSKGSTHAGSRPQSPGHDPQAERSADTQPEQRRPATKRSLTAGPSLGGEYTDADDTEEDSTIREAPSEPLAPESTKEPVPESVAEPAPAIAEEPAPESTKEQPRLNTPRQRPNRRSLCQALELCCRL